MKIYFGKAEQDDVEMFGDDGCFAKANPAGGVQYFYTGVEFGTSPEGMDGVTIFDGCGRSIPINMDHVEDLITALQHCQEINNTIRRAQTLQDTAESTETVYVENDDGYCYVVEND